MEDEDAGEEETELGFLGIGHFAVVALEALCGWMLFEFLADDAVKEVGHRVFAVVDVFAECIAEFAGHVVDGADG